MRVKRGAWLGTLAALGVVLALIGPGAAAAGAQQDCYPDGCTPPTGPPPQARVRCELDPRSGPSGAVVTATVSEGGGKGDVRILFDGEQVAERTAPLEGDVTISFQVPTDAEPGPHDVVASADSYSVGCRGGYRVTDGGGNGNGDGRAAAGQRPVEGQSIAARWLPGDADPGVVLVAAAAIAVLAALVRRAALRRWGPRRRPAG